MIKSSYLCKILIIIIIELFPVNNAANNTISPKFEFCSNENKNYTHNSPFANNLKKLLDSLPSNTSQKNGFYNTSIGDDSIKVYGQALCRGDVTSSVCQDCLQNANKQLLESCQSQEAIYWYELCQVHYSSRDFFSTMIYTGKYPDYDYQQKNVSDPAQFETRLVYLMNNISYDAAFSRLLMFATGEINVSRRQTIYGLVQCTRDIDNGSCNSCLQTAINELSGCCSHREGGVVFSRNCNVRFELYRFYNVSNNLVPYTTSKGNKWKTWKVVGVICVPAVVLVILVFSCLLYVRHKILAQRDEGKSQEILLSSHVRATLRKEGYLVTAQELPFIDLATLIAATDNFSNANKLGQGGFGEVYKGVLGNGKEIAVKRLLKKSWQGLEELKNEIILIAELQHRNLVRLVGCGIEGEEKMLIYEYMPNRSLDMFIFDSERRKQLDWKTCYNIIIGIARGLLYLHEDSRLKIIHRDLKPNNVLLDKDMVAKISDFGMARIFCENQNSANTRRVVGTYGYMAPEYAMEGLFSVKSDVFSYGVIVLEILSGFRNSGFHKTGHAPTLLSYVWRLWKEGRKHEFLDPALLQESAQVLRCMHIGLLCVQENPADRPTMSEVVFLLGSESATLPRPRKPAFSMGRFVPENDQYLTIDPSSNHMTVSDISPR